MAIRYVARRLSAWPVPKLQDQILGCLLCGAVGDAIGAQYEGNPPVNTVEIPRRLRVTDDTQLTLATCEAVIEAGGVDPATIASSFLRWHRSRRITGIGASTLSAVSLLGTGGHWASVGARGERAAGNGAAMRIAPLAFVLNVFDAKCRVTIRDVSRITHHNEEAYVGSLAILVVLGKVLAGHRLGLDLLPMVVDSIPDSLVRDRLIAIHDCSPSICECASSFGASGYVVDSVPLAILAACSSQDLVATIFEIVKAGGDTDTTASICGQIVGTAHGPDAVPESLARRLDLSRQIRKTAASLAKVCAAT